MDDVQRARVRLIWTKVADLMDLEASMLISSLSFGQSQLEEVMRIANQQRLDAGKLRELSNNI